MPPRRSDLVEPRSGSARARILRVAARLYTRHGYEATSMRAIADAAGVTKSLVAYHFGSKEELFSSLLREAIGASRASADAVLRRQGSAATRLQALLRAQFARAREAPEVVAFAHEVMTSPGLLPLGFDAKTAGCELFESYVRLIEGGQQRGEFRSLEARSVALVALAVVSTYVAAVLSGRLPRIPAGAEDTVFELILHGIESRQPAGAAAAIQRRRSAPRNRRTVVPARRGSGAKRNGTRVTAGGRR